MAQYAKQGENLIKDTMKNTKILYKGSSMETQEALQKEAEK